MKELKLQKTMLIFVIKVFTKIHLSIENYGKYFKKIHLARKRKRRKKMEKGKGSDFIIK
jgi:hypothetical protein